MKKGDIEIEYEGRSEEVTARYQEAFEWIKTFSVGTPKPKPAIKQKREKPEEKKEDKRGGARTGIIAPAIDELIKDGFLNDFKSATQVIEELKRKTIPISGRQPVITALNRRVPKKLRRIKDENKQWVYRKTQSDTGG